MRARLTTVRLHAGRGARGEPAARRAFRSGRVEGDEAVPRPRGVGALLDAATGTYAARFAVCVGLATALLLPFQMLSELLARSEHLLRGLGVLLAFSIPARFLCIGFIACFVADRLLGRAAQPGRAARRAAGASGRLLGVALAVGLISVPLVCMCFFPLFVGIWLFSLAPVIVALEGRTVADGLRRSMLLVGGWGALGRWLGVVLVGSALLTPASGLIGAVHEPAVRAFLETSLGVRGLAFDLLTTTVSAFLVAISTAFFAVEMTVLYVDQRVRKEGLDLELWLERLAPRARPAEAAA